jgi:predicted ATPase
MLTKLKLRNFKCFNEIEIDFGNLTVLAGGNATGKSSVIQAILFYSYVPKKNSLLVDVNDAYELNLGVASSLISHNPKGNDNLIEIEAETGERTGLVVLIPSKESPNALEHLNSAPNFGDVYIKYLKAERVGPRTFTRASGSHDDLGYSGEFTPSVIENADNRDIKVHTKLAGDKNHLKFSAQVEKWMSAIIGYMDIDITTDYTKGFTDMRIKNQVTDFGIAPTLTGFGITYVMPIVVAGLLCSARPGSVLIVENPEAHLHPMAQSNIGKFLAILAECGVQVIIETHSEHIVDGARVQLKNDNETDRMIVNFFELNNGMVTMETITLKNNGELTFWPKGFFDQKQSDLRELLAR